MLIKCFRNKVRPLRRIVLFQLGTRRGSIEGGSGARTFLIVLLLPDSINIFRILNWFIGTRGQGRRTDGVPVPIL